MPGIKRPTAIEGDIALVPLTRGYTAIVDVSDVHLIEHWNWCALPLQNKVYAYRKERVDGKQCHVSMHRTILGVTGFSVKVDHRDGDGLNNRRSNLRECSHTENLRNRGATRDNASGFKGVYLRSDGKAWKAEIKGASGRKHLGHFATREEAYAAYCSAAADFHGAFANCGTPEK